MNPGVWPVWTPEAWLARLITRTSIHCYTQNIKALDLLVSENKIFLCFSIVSVWKLRTPAVVEHEWHFSQYCCIQNIQPLCLVVSEKKNFQTIPSISLC